MAFLDRFKKQPHQGAKEKAPAKAEAPAKKDAADRLEAPKAAPKVTKDDTKDAYRVLMHPVVSEKAARAGEHRQYVFAVATGATRIAVARAVSDLYGVRPEKVNIVRVKGKRVRFGRRTGKQKDWKKAVVTLPAGKTISVYEGV